MHFACSGTVCKKLALLFVWRARSAYGSWQQPSTPPPVRTLRTLVLLVPPHTSTHALAEQHILEIFRHWLTACTPVEQSSSVVAWDQQC